MVLLINISFFKLIFIYQKRSFDIITPPRSLPIQIGKIDGILIISNLVLVISHRIYLT